MLTAIAIINLFYVDLETAFNANQPNKDKLKLY